MRSLRRLGFEAILADGDLWERLPINLCASYFCPSMSEGQLDSIVNGVHFWSGRAILVGASIDPRRASQERYLTPACGQMIPSGRLPVDRSLLYGIFLRSWDIADGL